MPCHEDTQLGLSGRIFLHDISVPPRLIKATQSQALQFDEDEEVLAQESLAHALACCSFFWDLRGVLKAFSTAV